MCYLVAMIFYALIAITTGIALAALTDATVWIWVILSCSVASMIALLGTSRGLRCYAALPCLIVVGMTYFEYRYHHLLKALLPASEVQKRLSIQGVIVDIPHQQAHSLSLLLSWQDQHECRLIRLNWYKPYPEIQAGDHWQLMVSLKPPHGLHNFGGFDYERWLIFHGISATGSVLADPSNKLLERHRNHTLLCWREHILTMIQRSITNPDSLGIVAALTTGSQSLIAPTQWSVFQRTGTNHLIAIAGLHMGMAAGFGFLLMGALGRCFPNLWLYVPRQCCQAYGAILMTLWYSILSGFSLPTQRAVIMILMMMSSLLIRRSIFFWYRFLTAFCVVVLWDPFSFFEISLWLSFGSVFWIAYVNNARFRHYKKFKSWWRLQVALCIGLMPLTVLAFGQVSFLGLIANAVAVPWITFLVLPLCLLATLSMGISIQCATMLFHLSSILLVPLWHYLTWVSQDSWGVWVHSLNAPWAMVLGVIGAFLLLLPRGISGRYLGIYLCLPLLCYNKPFPGPNELYVTILDVGQGLSLLIQTSHHALLYDAGPKNEGGFDAGFSVVVPYLHYANISHLNTLIISHGDNDHIGGADTVLRDIPTQHIITSVPNKFTKAMPCYQGQHWQWENADFDVLWPLKDASYTDNNSSCVVRVTEGSMRILLTGDIEQSTEQWLVAHKSAEISAEILVVPHHGSVSSSSALFITAVHPKWVIVSSGLYNRYHFPSKIVLKRYKQAGAIVYNTASDGAVRISMNNRRIESVIKYVKFNF